MTFTIVTTGRSGSFHPRPNREACRWVSRPHRASGPHPCLPVRIVQLIVVDGSFNRLKPRVISGEIATPAGTGASDMRSTGTGSDPVFAHVDPHSGPCAVLPPNGDVAHRTDRGHFTISAETSPPPTVNSFSRPRDERLSPVESFPIAGDFHCSPSRKLGAAQSTPAKRLPLTPETFRQRCARMRHRRPLAAYRFSPDIRHRPPYIHGARHANEAEQTMISIEETSKTRHHTISMSRTAISPNTSPPSSSDERRQRREVRVSALGHACSVLRSEVQIASYDRPASIALQPNRKRSQLTTTVGQRPQHRFCTVEDEPSYTIDPSYV